MTNNVIEIWAADADPELIAPLTIRYKSHATIGASQSYAFGTLLSVIAPGAVYDFIDYREQDLTGEELYDAIKGQLDSGFKGGQQATKAQGRLLKAYDFLINPPGGS